MKTGCHAGVPAILFITGTKHLSAGGLQTPNWFIEILVVFDIGSIGIIFQVTKNEFPAETRFLIGAQAFGVSPGCSFFHLASKASLDSFLAASGCGAPTGQTSAHLDEALEPTHSVHLSGSITKLELPSLIALFGHSDSQAPQLIQSSVIL
jgi:hypothetical protein